MMNSLTRNGSSLGEDLTSISDTGLAHFKELKSLKGLVLSVFGKLVNVRSLWRIQLLPNWIGIATTRRLCFSS